MDKCEGCFFSRFADPKQPNALAMWCCRNPPQQFLVSIINPMTRAPEPQVQAFFAPTRYDNWCGEFKPKVTQ